MTGVRAIVAFVGDVEDPERVFGGHELHSWLVCRESTATTDDTSARRRTPRCGDMVSRSGASHWQSVTNLPAAALDDVFFRAALESGRPVAELEAELRAENAALDRLCGAVACEPVVRAAAGDERWRTRPDDEFAPS